ncbi:MAG: hypothetical protein EXS16_17535 [Gemmataceae bacterium]|nr:hypothetical protein [Gemmataceae bacterium]
MRIVTAVLALLFLAITPFAGSSAQEAKSKPNSKLSSAEIWSRYGIQRMEPPRHERGLHPSFGGAFNTRIVEAGKNASMPMPCRRLTDMADLKVVILETGIYVTTPERASVMEKELRDAKKASAVPTTSP